MLTNQQSSPPSALKKAAVCRASGTSLRNSWYLHHPNSFYQDVATKQSCCGQKCWSCRLIAPQMLETCRNSPSFSSKQGHRLRLTEPDLTPWDGKESKAVKKQPFQSSLEIVLPALAQTSRVVFMGLLLRWNHLSCVCVRLCPLQLLILVKCKWNAQSKKGIHHAHWLVPSFTSHHMWCPSARVVCNWAEVCGYLFSMKNFRFSGPFMIINSGTISWTGNINTFTKNFVCVRSSTVIIWYDMYLDIRKNKSM